MSDAGSEKPLALLVTRNFPPLIGGMEKLNQKLLQGMLPDWRLALSGPFGSGEFAPAGTIVREAPLRPLAAFLLASAWGALRLAMNSRPRVVVAGSGLAVPMAWLAARASGARLGVYLHGLDIIAPSRIYQYLWLFFIRRCDAVLTNSHNTARLAQGRGIAAQRITVLHPGTDLPGIDPSRAQGFVDSRNLAGRRILLSVGRLTRRKGLVEFVRAALPDIVRRDATTLLVVIGDEARDALHAGGGGERERILAAAVSAGIADHVRFLGRCDEADLMAAYEAADCHVFPVLEMPGDVEGFGMVALEASAHGLPTVAFAVGGVPDAVCDRATGRLVSPGDYVAFAEAVDEVCRRGKADFDAPCRQFAQGLSWPVFGERLRLWLAGLTRADPRG